jgi:hypothetical protein
MSRVRAALLGLVILLAVIVGLTAAFAVAITDFVTVPSWNTLFVAAMPALFFGIPGGLFAALVIVGSRFSPPRRNEKTPPPE